MVLLESKYQVVPVDIGNPQIRVETCVWVKPYSCSNQLCKTMNRSRTYISYIICAQKQVYIVRWNTVSMLPACIDMYECVSIFTCIYVYIYVYVYLYVHLRTYIHWGILWICLYTFTHFLHCTALHWITLHTSTLHYIHEVTSSYIAVAVIPTIPTIHYITCINRIHIQG